MRFKVDCPHCGAMLSVPEKYHYTTIKCPDCGEAIEAVSTETRRVTRDFLEGLEEPEDEVGVTSLPRVATLKVPGGSGE